MPSPGALLQSNAVKPPGLFSFKLPLCQLGGTFFAEKQNQIPNHSHGQRPSAIQRPAAPAAQVFLPPLHTQAFQVCFLRGCSPLLFCHVRPTQRLYLRLRNALRPLFPMVHSKYSRFLPCPVLPDIFAYSFLQSLPCSQPNRLLFSR